MRFGIRIFSAALLAASLLAAPALAQVSATVGAPEKGKKNEMGEIADQHRARQKEIDKEYDAMRRLTDTDTKPVKVDPWANMRSSGETQQQKR